MILTLQIGPLTLSASCPDDALVFDGKSWAAPAVGRSATLVFVEPKVGSASRLTYPVNERQVGYDFRINTNYECLITGIAPGTVGGAGYAVLVSDKPTDSDLCLVCNMGTQLLNVKVSNAQ